MKFQTPPDGMTHDCLCRAYLFIQITSIVTPKKTQNMENDNFTLSEEINGILLAAVIGLEAVVGLITNFFVLILTLPLKDLEATILSHNLCYQ